MAEAPAPAPAAPPVDPEGLKDRLYNAIEQANIVKIRKALEAGASANYPADGVRDRKSPIVHYMMGTNVSDPDGPEIDIKIVRLLLDAGANPNGNMDDDPPIVHLADYSNIVSLLLEKGADPNVMVDEKTTLLNFFIDSNANIDSILAVIDAVGVDLNARGPDDKTTPLEKAIRKRNIQIVERLLLKGANPNLVSPDQDSPLYVAVAANYPDMVRLLVERGANPNQPSKTGYMPIHIAHNPDSIAILRAGGADMNARNPRGETAIVSEILRKKSMSIHLTIKALIENGADPNIPAPDGYTPLYIALDENKEKVVIELLKGGANPNVNQEDGTPVVKLVLEDLNYGIAAGDVDRFQGYSRILREMIARGLDPNIRLEDGEGILHNLIGTACGSPDGLVLLQELVRLGANPNAVDDTGMTPLDIVVFLNIRRNLRAIVDIGFDPNAISPQGTATLHRIVDRPTGGAGNWTPKEIEIRVYNAVRLPGIDINIRNRAGETALHIAARRNNASAVEALVNSGADKSLRVGGEGPTALELAADENVKRILRGYAGKSRETIGLFERIFENPANISICPVCLAFADREDGCRYMSHICKPGERVEKLYNRYKGGGVYSLNKIEWCTECGRICDTEHRHYQLAPIDVERPGLAPVDPARAPLVGGILVHYLPDCRPSGGGGLEEKFLRFYELIKAYRELQARVETATLQDAKLKAIRAYWDGPFDEGRTPEDQVIRRQLRDLAGLLRSPPPPGSTPEQTDEWNARVASLKTFGIDMSVFPEDAPPVGPAEVAAPDVPRPEADRELLPIIINNPAGPAAAGGAGGNFCVANLGPHEDGRPTFQLRHRQPDGRVYTHPPAEAICGEDLVSLINSGAFTGKCPINPDVCKADIHPDELDAFGDQIPEEFRRNYRSKYNRLKAGLLAGGGRRKTYRKKSRRATGRKRRGGRLDPEVAQQLFREMDESEYVCSFATRLPLTLDLPLSRPVSRAGVPTESPLPVSFGPESPPPSRSQSRTGPPTAL
jgi:ankyrin repeat protein